jgi:hypothetical protein
MKITICRIALSATVLLVFGMVPPAFAQTLAVGTCTAFPNYPTIQQAVNAATGFATIEVCPGTYPEQVFISKPLTLEGVPSSGQQVAVVVPPVGGVVKNTRDFDANNLPVAAQILVQDTFGVTLKDLVVDGAGNGLSGCGTDIMGILFQNASGAVNHVVTRNQTLDPADYGCQDGEGIFVETQSQYGYLSMVSVKNSSVHNYQKNGITGDDLGTTMTISSNEVQGWGASPAIAQNGIQLCCGATGKITSNSVIDDIYTGPSYGASGILLYDTLENSGISVGSNTVGNAQYPVALVTDDSFGSNQYGDGVTVSGNQIFGTTVSSSQSGIDFDAIDACTNGNTITGNTVTNSWYSAIHMDSSCSGSGNSTGNNNTVTGNTINESECAGILVDSTTTGDTTTPNTFYNVFYTVTSTTSSCTFPSFGTTASVAFPVGPTRSMNVGHLAFSPKGRTHGQAQSKR